MQQPAKLLAPAVQELQGILSRPADFDYKTQRDEPVRRVASFMLDINVVFDYLGRREPNGAAVVALVEAA